MVFVAEALAAWLVGQVADAGRKRLTTLVLGSDQERALQQAATAAIQATARHVQPRSGLADDPQGIDQLAGVIDQVFQDAPTPAEALVDHATLLQGLQAGVAARLAVLGDVDITGTGQSSAEVLGVEVAEVTQTLTRYLLREILIRGASGGPLAALANQLDHDLTHLQGQEQSAILARLAKDLQTALAALDRRDQRAKLIPARATPSLGRPIRELTDPFALEVHRAIDVAAGREAPLPELPPYIERHHDRRLQGIVEQAIKGRSVAAVLVGESSTGKTRACWEAIQTLPDDWRLWHPIDPSRPEATADALPVVGPRTVIWLNEANQYLLTPASDLGERVAAGLRELLRDPERGPVLLLGTIWPEYWDILTRPPAPGQPDPHAQARALLTGTDIPVPDAFTGPALRAMQAAAKSDPRLGEAADRAEDGHITQFLAGGPALLERYRNAPVPAKALIEAAMDARRMGHGLHLPRALLQAAAPGYLTDQQWDALSDDWLEQALAYCAVPCRGARGPLTQVRPRPGESARAQPCYRLADYLEHTSRRRRRTVLAPAALWDALVAAADTQDLPRIAQEAARRRLNRQALRLYQRAAEAGDSHALLEAADVLRDASRVDEANNLFQRAVEAGDPEALRRMAQPLERAGRIDEATDWYQRAAEGGDRYALGKVAELAELSEDAGRVDEAIGWLQTRAIEAGDPQARWEAARLMGRAGRLDDAINWLQTRATEADDPNSLWEAVTLWRRPLGSMRPLACTSASPRQGT